MNTNKYNYIKITKRKVSEKLQPSVKVGQIYKVESTDKTKSGAKVVVVSIDGKPTRCNSERFSWEPMSDREVAEHKFKATIKENIQKITQKFTEEESMRMSLIPLIMAEIAWTYAFKTINKGREERVQEVKGLSRAIKHLREQYTWHLERDLTRNNIANVRRYAEQFTEEHEINFVQLFYTTSNAIYQQNKGTQVLHNHLRTYAYLSKLFILAYEEKEREIAKMIGERLGHAQAKFLPFMPELKECVDAYLNFEIVLTDEIKTGLKIYKNQIKTIEINI